MLGCRRCLKLRSKLVQDYTSSEECDAAPEDVHFSVRPLRIGLIVEYVRHSLDCNFLVVRPDYQRQQSADLMRLGFSLIKNSALYLSIAKAT